jgi:hypothetical protein
MAKARHFAYVQCRNEWQTVFRSGRNLNYMIILFSPVIGSVIWIGGGGVGLLLVIVVVVLLIR